MGSTQPGLIFVGISARFKLHNVINSSEQGKKIPQGQQEIAPVVSSAGSLDLKAFTLQTKRNSRFEKCNIRILSVPVTSNVSRGPHLDTDRWSRVALSLLSAFLLCQRLFLETLLLWTWSPHIDWTYSSEKCMKLCPLWARQRRFKATEVRPLRVLQQQVLNSNLLCSTC